MLIDKISYGNPIKDINPGIKFLLSMTTLIFLLCTENKGVIVFNLILFNLLLLLVVKVKISDCDFFVINKSRYLVVSAAFICRTFSSVFSDLLYSDNRFRLYICKIEISENIQRNVSSYLQIYISFV